jgi:hypothetical protein
MIPFPMPLTTPPQTRMYFMATVYRVFRWYFEEMIVKQKSGGLRGRNLAGEKVS